MKNVMTALEAVIVCADERLQVLLSPAIEGMLGGPLLAAKGNREIKLVSLVDDRTLEPALYHNPYFVLPAAGQNDRYIRFLQALRHTDNFALATTDEQTQKSTCLLYPHKDYLMLVMIRTEEELVEPPPPDWTAEAAALTSADVAHLRAKLESLNQAARSRSAKNGF